jgi:hypothetical protein
VATKAERAKARTQVERSRKRAADPRASAKRTQRSPAKSDAGAKYRTGTTATRNRTRRADRKASWVLEDSAKRPSRKSTRKASNRAKPDSNLRRRQMRRTRSPKVRATRAAAARK